MIGHKAPFLCLFLCFFFFTGLVHRADAVPQLQVYASHFVGDFKITDTLPIQPIDAAIRVEENGCGRLVLDHNNQVLVLSRDRETGTLTSLDSGNVSVNSPLLTGINRKALVATPSGWMVAVDYWPGIGNDRRGIFALAYDGSFRQLSLTGQYNGLSDLINAPDKGWLFCDFEADNIYHLSAEGVAEQSIFTSNPPKGLYGLSYEPASRKLYAIELKGGHYFAASSRLYRVSGDKAEPVYEGQQIAGITVNHGSLLPKGLYFSDQTTGSIYTLTQDDKAVPVITGLNKPSDILFDPLSGALLVICEDSYVMRFGAKGKMLPPGMKKFKPGTIEIVDGQLKDVIMDIDGRTFISGENGIALLEGIQPGKHTISIAHKGYHRHKGEFVITPGKEKISKVRLQPVARMNLSGMVKLQNTTPVAGAHITLNPIETSVVHNGQYFLSSDFSGSYTVHDIPHGRYKVSVEAPGCLSLETTLELPLLQPEDSNLILTQEIDRQSSLKVKIVDSFSKKPILAAKATLSEAGAAGIIAQGLTDKQGHVLFPKLAVGKFNLAHDNRLQIIREQLTLTIQAKGYDELIFPFELGKKELEVQVTPQMTVKEQEPNNDLATAQPILPGVTVQAAISEKGDKDVFQFRLHHRGYVILKTGEKPPLQTVLRLFDAQGKELKVTTRYVNQQNQLHSGGLLPGLYFFQLEEWGNNTASEQAIDLSITVQTAPDALEPNDNKKQARLIGINQEVRGTTLPLGDQDWFRFSVKRPGQLQVVVEKNETQRAVYLYSGDEEKELTAKGVYAGQQLVLHRDLIPGEYLLCLREWGDNSESLVPYTIRLSYIDDDQIDDPAVDNTPLTTGRKLSHNGMASSTIWPLHDQDLFQLKLPTAGRLMIEGKSVIQLHLILRNGKGEKLLEKGVYSNQINSLTYECNDPETLFLEVQEWGNNSASTALYTLKTSWQPADDNDARQRNDDPKTATMIKAGITLRYSIIPLKDIDIYRLELDHPGYLRVKGQAPGQLQIRWLDKDHKELANQGYYARQIIDVAVPVLAETYFLEVREWGDNSIILQPYNLQVIHERAEPGEKLFAEDDPPRLLESGKAQSFVFDQIKDIDSFTYRVKEPGKVVISIKNPLQTHVRIIDEKDQSVVFEHGYYALNKIVASLDIKEATTLAIHLTEWGNNARTTEPGFIVVDTKAHNMPLIRVQSVACGYRPGTICFSLDKPENEPDPLLIQLDTNSDGVYDLTISNKDGAEHRFPKPGLYQVGVKIIHSTGVETVQRTWVDARQTGAQLDMQLSLDGVTDGQIVNKEQDIVVFTAPSSGARVERVSCSLDDKLFSVLHTPPYIVKLPWLKLKKGEHVLQVDSVDSRGEKKSLKRSFQLSEYFDLQPANGAGLTGENVRISWSGDNFGSAVVKYRLVGKDEWQKVTGESGRRRSVLLKGLVPGERYEYQAFGGKQPSPTRTFQLLKGLAFGQSSYGVNIKRDYNQRFGISVRNNGDQPLSVHLECGRPADPLLLVGFVGAGSEDKPFPLKPGEERQFMLGMSAQDVLTANHSFPVRIVSDSGLSDVAEVNVSVRLPNIKLEWEALGAVPYGMGQKYRLVNRGDTVTDLAVFSKSDTVYITPSINHGLLPAGGNIEVTVYPHLYEEFTGVSAEILARGLNKTFSTTMSVQLADDEKLYPTYLIPGIDPVADPDEYKHCLKNALRAVDLDPKKVDWTESEFPEDQDMDGADDRWYVLDTKTDVLWAGDDSNADGAIDFVHADKGMDGIYEFSAYLVGDKWQETNLVEAWLEMGFSLPWNQKSYHPHDVDIVLNDSIIGVLRDTIPNGNYTFRIPPQVIKFNEEGMPAGNFIGIKTKHLRGGHYVVNSDYRFNFRLTATPVWSVGKNRADAYQKALAIDGMSLEAPDYSISSANMHIGGPEILETGLDLQVQGKIRNLGALSTPTVTVALFDQRPGRDKKEISRISLDDVPVSGLMPVGLPWKTTGGDHQLSIVVDPDNSVNDSNRINNEATLFVSIPGDDDPPELKIVTPVQGSVLKKSITGLQVQAQDSVEIAYVEVSIDGGLWQLLKHAGKDMYGGSLLLQPGSHTIVVRAVDGSGNEQEENIAVKVKLTSPQFDVVFPKPDSELLSRSCPVMLKVSSGTTGAAARVNGGPWYRAKLTGGFVQVTVPLRFGKQQVEAMVVRKDGVVNLREIDVTCTRQPAEGEQEKFEIEGKNSSGLFYLSRFGEVDFFSQWNQILF